MGPQKKEELPVPAVRFCLTQKTMQRKSEMFEVSPYHISAGGENSRGLVLVIDHFGQEQLFSGSSKIYICLNKTKDTLVHSTFYLHIKIEFIILT